MAIVIPETLKTIAVAQLRPVVGDVPANVGQILSAMDQAQQRGARLLLCPELMLVGYPPDDLLTRRGLPAQVRDGLDALQAQTGETAIVIGYPEYADGTIYNSVCVMHRGRQVANYRKRRLPNYGVFDEKRHFSAGDEAVVFDFDGCRYGLTICEDIWHPQPAAAAVAAGAQVILNINASPFDRQKSGARRAELERRSAETGVPIVYANAVGGQDDVVFDGESQVWADGARVGCWPRFQAGVFGWEDLGDAVATETEAVHAALVMGIRDYVQPVGFSRAYVGLSGGIDSAVTLSLAVHALGPDRVAAVAMPSRYSADISESDARRQAQILGVDFQVVPIESTYGAFEAALEPAFAGRAPDLTEENLQARIRGTLLMALSNKFNGIVLSTSNKSEMAVGYSTLYGDMCGGYAPIKDVYKTQVYDLARWINRDGEEIPWRVIERPPSAELRHDQKDEDSLPPYPVLDEILMRYVEAGEAIEAIVAAGFDREVVEAVASLVRRSEYKRRQAAPGPKVSRCAFGRERRYPITARYAY